MKKYLFIAALAGLTLVGCTSDDFVGDTTDTQSNPTGAINFGGGFRAVTRADALGADAAALLGNKFYVAGVKGDGVVANMTDVFKTYTVDWAANTAGTTESNTSDWEYVGKTHDFTATTSISSQTIKYWDYSTAYYDFAAYSKGTGSATGTAINYANATTGAYTLQGNKENLSKCYITDMITVAKASYGGEVTLQFRSLASKVRMAIYETVPGYAVKDVHFYVDDATAVAGNTTISNTAATLFGADAFYTEGTYTVSFPTIGIANNGEADYNKAHVAFSSTGTASNQGFGTLNYVAGEGALTGSTNYLGRTSATASFAGLVADNYYQTMLPNETGVVLEMRVNYVLESIDGSGETITVHGAKAFVPQIYTKWLPNYAYTYIFKISDNTNGWTDPTGTDPAGLYPITFDAVVLDPINTTNEQTTITTVATPSITTYQKGHLYSDGSEYLSSKGDIYVQVMAGSTLKDDLGSKGKLYAVTGTTPYTEAAIMDALNIGTTSGSVVTGRNGVILTDATTSASVAATITTVPGIDGNNITVTSGTAAKFTPSAGTVYAYVYDATPATAPAASYLYTAETLISSPADWGTAGVWFTDPNGTTPVGTYTDGTYYKKWTNQNKVYGVKIIRVI